MRVISVESAKFEKLLEKLRELEVYVKVTNWTDCEVHVVPTKHQQQALRRSGYVLRTAR